MAFATKLSFEDQVAEHSRIWAATDVDNTATIFETKSRKLTWVFIENTTVATTYVKFYNSVSVVAGTTEPNMILPVPNAGEICFVFPSFLSSVFTTGLTILASTTGGRSATAPAVGINMKVATRAS